MASLLKILGKGLASGSAKRTKLIAAGAGLGALALGGIAVRKALRRGDDQPGPTADPIAQTPTAPPGAGEKEVPEKADVPEADEKPAAAQRTIPVPHPEPPIPTGADAPPNPAVEPGNISADKEPHHALNNPVRDPDETEYPDPYEKREDPRDPVDPDGEPFGEEPHPATGSESTSEPPAWQDPDRVEPPQRDKLDD